MQLSQHSLSDFVDCPRRYYLQHATQQPWPLLETGPGGIDVLEYRGYLRRGVQLHRMIERSILGITNQAAGTGIPELDEWFARFLTTDLGSLPQQQLPELALVAPLGTAGLYVRYDVLAYDESRTGGVAQARRFVIVDWKTIRGEHPPKPSWFRNRIQTRAYLYALVAGGAPFNDGVPIEPAQCSMRYWLANFPTQPWVEVPYTQAEFDADQRRLLGLATDIAARAGKEDYPLTEDVRKCTYCNFRTLCNRTGAPEADDMLDDETSLDLSDSPELEY